MISWSKYDPEFHGYWDDQLHLLAGANFFQTVGWGQTKQAMGWHVLKLVAIEGDAIVAMALVLFRIQPFRGALAWLPGGLCGKPASWVETLPIALKRELGVRWLYLRSNQVGFEQSERVTAALTNARWSQPSVRLGSGLSLVYDTKPSDVDRLAAMSANWRHNLKRSRKNGLRFEQWLEPDAVAIIKIYRLMESLKALTEQVTQTELEAMFEHLKHSMVLYKCETAQGELIAIRAYARFNNQAFDLLAAAAPIARKLYASHGLLWALLNDCHEKGIDRYDLGGVDPVKGKGVYDFKHGTGATLIRYLGEWEFASPSLIKAILNLALRFRQKFRG